MAYVELVSLVKRYGDIPVVDDVSLAIEKGQLVCLLGPSGCGKTTTLRLIAGFAQPTAGEIRVGAKTLSSAGWAAAPERRNMSMIFQSYALWPHMTVAENVGYGLQLRRLSSKEIKAKVSEILGVARLSEFADRYPGELSGGQQQRVSLARALVVEPDILLLDEPLSNLDANLREEMRFEIRRLHDEYRYTTVYVTHDQSEAMTTADVIAVMKKGRIVQAGSPEEIYKQPKSEFVARFIGGTNIFKGPHEGDVVDCGNGLFLRCGGGDFATTGETFVSIRQHDIKLSTAEPPANTNRVQGIVSRQVYLGTHRDYLVNLPSGASIRAITDESFAVPQGQQVWLYFPPDRCRALSH